jgi:hypothetical protein
MLGQALFRAVLKNADFRAGNSKTAASGAPPVWLTTLLSDEMEDQQTTSA